MKVNHGLLTREIPDKLAPPWQERSDLVMHARQRLALQYSTNRMVRDYVEAMYL